jgi:hypothetical protein
MHACTPSLLSCPVSCRAHDGLHNSWRVGPAASPNRSGSPASPHTLALQQQHWQDGSPRSVRTAGSFRRGYSNSAGNSPQHQQQRPRSPGAAGLVDAAAAVAAELEAEREEAARMSNRLRFAEDKILQQVCVRVECVNGCENCMRCSADCTHHMRGACKRTPPSSQPCAAWHVAFCLACKRLSSCGPPHSTGTHHPTPNHVHVFMHARARRVS